MKRFLPAIVLSVFLAACTVGPLSGAKVIRADEKEVTILSDGFVDPFRTAGEQCGRFGKSAKLVGREEGTKKQVYYYKCQ